MTGDSKLLLVCVNALCMCVSCDLLDHFTVQIMCNHLKKNITIKNISAPKIVSKLFHQFIFSPQFKPIRLNKCHDIMAANTFVQCPCVTRDQTIIIYDPKRSRDRVLLEGWDAEESSPQQLQIQV